MKNIRYLVISIVAIFIVLILVLLIDTTGSSSNSNISEEDAAIAALFGVKTSARNAKNQTGGFSNDKNFMTEGLNKDTIDEEAKGSTVLNKEEPDILEPADGDNPINPETGQPYSNKTMKRFAALHKKFPKNKLIPTKQTEKEKAEDKKREQQIYSLSTKVIQGTSTKDEVNKFYEMQKKDVMDRKQLLDYFSKSKEGMLSEKMQKKIQKINKINNRLIEELEFKRKASLQYAKD